MPDSELPNKVFDILVEHAGASESFRNAFVFWMTTLEEKASKAVGMSNERASVPRGSGDVLLFCWTPREFSFEGKLGVGGKFWANSDQAPYFNNGYPYINCYPEDLTQERELVIQTVNELLAELE